VWSQTGGCKQREYKESLEKYNARFKLTLTQGAWVRTILGKSTEGAWIIKMRELFIENLNCPLIKVLVIDMPETHSLQDIFAKLQRLGRNLDLDADVKPPGGIVSKPTTFKLNNMNMHQDRQQFLNNDDATVGRDAHQDKFADMERMLDTTNSALFELSEKVHEQRPPVALGKEH
jgi:hypothetical protein